jgi:hypothetical protein
MMIDFPSVKLQDQTIRAPLASVKVRIPEPFVFGSTMTADAREKSLVPAARGLNVAAVDEGLGAHERTIHPLSQGLFSSIARGDRVAAQRDFHVAVMASRQLGSRCHRISRIC